MYLTSSIASIVGPAVTKTFLFLKLKTFFLFDLFLMKSIILLVADNLLYPNSPHADKPSSGPIN